MYDGMQIIHLFGYNNELSKMYFIFLSPFGKKLQPKHIGLLQVWTMIYLDEEYFTTEVEEKVQLYN
jgi:hypothetical protein